MANLATGLLQRFIPESAGLTDDDKKALARQGLLSVGLGILGAKTGGNFGASLAEGLKGGLLAVNGGAEDISNQRYKNQMLASQAAGGSEFRSADAMARAAGYEPGTDDYKRAFRVGLGVDPRASSAAIGYQKVKGADGVERLVAVDPRAIGAQVVGDGAGYGSFAEPAALQDAPQPAQDFMDLAQQFPGAQMTSGLRTQAHNRAVGGVGNSQHLGGTAADFAVPPNVRPAFLSTVKQLGYQAIDEGDHIHVQRQKGGNGPNPFAGRRPEDEAAAIEAAKTNVQLAALPAELGMRTNAAIQQAGGTATVTEAAKAQAERNATVAQRSRDAGDAFGLLDEADRILPSATGGNAGNIYDSAAGFFGKATPGAQATAQLKTIAGQLTAKMPRMQGPQSDKDVQMYKEMAGDLANADLPVATRMAAAKQIRRLQEKYANAGTSTAPKRLKFNPATGKLENGNRG